MGTRTGFVVLACGVLWLSGCDDDESGGGAATDAGSEQDSGPIPVPDAATQSPLYPDCQRDDILPPPTWDLDGDGVIDDPPATMAEVDACFMACDPLTQACVDSEPDCSTFSDFNLCINLVSGNCASPVGEAITCYDEWQTYNCCIDERCDDAEDLGQCIGAQCSDEADEYFGCVDNNMNCLRSGLAVCIAPEDEPVMGDAGTDASADVCSCECVCANTTISDIGCFTDGDDCCEASCGVACTGGNGAYQSSTLTCEAAFIAAPRTLPARTQDLQLGPAARRLNGIRESLRLPMSFW